MGNFDRNNRDRGGRDRRFGGSFGGGFNRREGGRPEMFKAICAECGKSCEIPFKPQNDKPVYCRDCFDKRGGKENRDSFRDNRSFNRDDRGRGEREMFSVTCDSCGKRCEVPFRPSSNKPVYCDDCFGREGNSRDSRGGNPANESRNSGINNELKEQLKNLNDKMDRLLRALELRGKIEPSEVVEVKIPKIKKVAVKKIATEIKPEKVVKKTKPKAKTKKSV